MEENGISINKFLSSKGLCSRREADKLIETGRVLLNDIQAQKGNRVFPGDRVKLDGKLIKNKNFDKVYLMLHKPPGITSTTDERDKDNIISFINFPKRIFPIGRLDKASSGLILLTNDGDVVNKILRAENKHEKEYIVKLNRPFDQNFLNKMSKGIPILGTVTKKCKTQRIGKQVFRIILTQGLNRQIRRMCEYLGYKVQTLKRIRVMHLDMGDLPVGHWRQLNEEEKNELFKRLSKELLN